MAIANENIGEQSISVGSVVIADPASYVSIYKSSEITVATKTKTQLVSYTVPSGKTFKLYTMEANFDLQSSPLYLRLEKQTAGAGAWAVIARLTLQIHGQDPSDQQLVWPEGLKIASASDILRLTYESALARGSLWAQFTGVES
jgi:hypothetical protein